VTAQPVAGDVIGATPGFEHASAVADAVLYEGYVLYPYRKSSSKNQVRWQFGILATREWIEGQGPVTDGVAGSTESWWQQTECLLDAPTGARVHVRPRFLQLQSKTVEERQPDGSFRPVDRLDLGHRAEVPFDEAVPHETDVLVPVADLLDGEHRHEFGAPAGEDVETAYDDHGVEVGRVVRRRWPVTAVVRLSAERQDTPFRLFGLRVRIDNTGSPDRPLGTRDEALRHSMIATHSFVGVDRGSLVSLLDPPEWASAAAKACRNVRTFPVLTGEPGGTRLVLSSPIILYDHAQVAPESPGDLHDACEIDEILSLRTLTLTDEEKREARATDPRVAAIVDRVDTMPPEIMERLHGAVRSLDPGWTPRTGIGAGTGPVEGQPWWEPGADDALSPETDHVLVDGVRVARGSRVRLRPGQRADAHDMFLAGRSAEVDRVLLDVDGTWQVAVTIEDDPSAELHQWYGRFHYFRPEELEPLDGVSGQ
jgi:hypothetical protein